MYGARKAIAGGLTHIEQQVTAIEQAVVENPGLAFDLSRTLVESACRSVLGERSVSVDSDDDLPTLFKLATRSLPFLPAEVSTQVEVRRSLAQTLNGLHTAVQGICELRNRCGFASHGSGAPRPPLQMEQALLAAEAADTIVGFLCGVHRLDRAPHASKRALFEENGEFNDYVDGATGPIQVLEAEFRPSDVLFQLEPQTYQIYLADFQAEREDDPESAP
jgi:hypothetical protein